MIHFDSESNSNSNFDLSKRGKITIQDVKEIIEFGRISNLSELEITMTKQQSLGLNLGLITGVEITPELKNNNKFVIKIKYL